MEGAAKDSQPSDTSQSVIGEGSGAQDQGMSESNSVASFNTDNN